MGRETPFLRPRTSRTVEGIVKNYLAIANEDYMTDDVSEAYRIVKKKRLKRSDEVRVDLSHCRYDVLRTVIKKLGWQETCEDSRSWHLFWTDTSIGPERLMSLRRGQKVNHFFGMLQICRKKSLARHLSTMRKMFPAEYRFFPRAFILPNQLQEFLSRFNTTKCRTYILKPDSGSQGKGVALVQNISDVKQAIGGFSGANMLAQKYITNPMLINGYKFDLRIYTLILSCDPLRLYLYREGLVRFCTLKYMKPTRDNLRFSCMHLTNYSLNKYNPNFEHNDTDADKGSKWSLSGLYRALASRGYDTRKLKLQIKKMVVMTFLAIAPYLTHNYRTCMKEGEDDNGRSCFEVLGMDVLIDEKCRPWLLEVNHSPSFSIETVLDLKVKEALLSDTLRLIHVDPSGLSRIAVAERKNAKIRLYGKNDNFEEPTKLSVKEMDQYEAEHMGNFDRIYPCEDENLQKLYDVCLAGAEESFKQSFDMKVKKAIAKAQEERKQEVIEKEIEERRRQRQRVQMRKRAQESARRAAAAVSRHSELGEGEEAGQGDMDLRMYPRPWDSRCSDELQRKMSPRCMSLLPVAASTGRRVAWEETLRNQPWNIAGGFRPPQGGLLPPIRGCFQRDGCTQTSEELALSRDIICRHTQLSPRGRMSPPTGKRPIATASCHRLPDNLALRLRRRSISPSPPGGLSHRTLPTARLIFDEPVVTSARTDPQSSSSCTAKWHSGTSKLQMCDVLRALKKGGDTSGGLVVTATTAPVVNASSHVCRICRPLRMSSKYESRRLRDFVLKTSSPSPTSGDEGSSLVPPRQRVVNAFATHSDPNRFLVKSTRI